jgi:hypothetical protein
MKVGIAERQTPIESPPHTPLSVDEESSGYDRRFDRKLTQVYPGMHRFYLVAHAQGLE